MSERDRKRSLLLVALIFALGIAVPKLVGAPAGGRASVAAHAQATTPGSHPSHSRSSRVSLGESKDGLPGLAPAPTTPSTRDLAFAG